MHKKYLTFLTLSFLKSKFFKIFLAINVITIIAFMAPIVANSQTKFIANNSLLILILPFIFFAIFATLVATIIYKDQAQQGSDLFIVASGIKRNQIFAHKLLLSLAIIMFYQIFFGIIFGLIFTIFDQKMTFNELVIATLSIVTGGLIIQLFFFALATLLQMKVSKSVATICTIFLAIFIPLGSFFMTPIFNGSPRQISAVEKPLFITNLQASNEQEFQELVSDQYYYDDYSTNIDQDLKAFNKTNTYRNVAIFDLWYHANLMMNIFNHSDKFKANVVQKWTINANQRLNTSSALAGKNKYLGVAVDKDELKASYDNFTTSIVDVAKQISNYFALTNNEAKMLFNTESNLAQRLLFVQMISQTNQPPTQIDQNLNNLLKSDNDKTASLQTLLNIDSLTPIIYKYLMDHYQTSEQLTLPQHEIQNFHRNSTPVGHFFVTGTYATTYQPTPYFNIRWSFIIFSVATIVFIWWAWAIFLQKEIE